MELRKKTIPEQLLLLPEAVEELTLAEDDEDASGLAFQKCFQAWNANGRPIFVLDRELQFLLANTSARELDELPKLLLEGMWVQLAVPIMLVSERQPIEGFWLRSVTSKGEAFVLVYAMGQDIVFAAPLARNPVDDPKELEQYGVARVIRSLLYALRWKQILQQTEVTPPALPAKPSRRERREHEREEGKGKSFARYVKLSLSQADRPAKAKTVGEGTGMVISAHIVMGHWHHYWVREPGEGCVVKVNEKGLSLVAKWVLPYVRGTGDVNPITAKVSA